MPRRRLSVPAPIGGVSRNWSFTAQPPATVLEGRNMRGIDPSTGRTRGAQGPGTERFYGAGNLPSGILGAGRVQKIQPISFEVPVVDHILLDQRNGAAHEDATVPEWEVDSTTGDFLGVQVEPGGGVVVLDDRGTFTRFSSDGERGVSGSFPKADNEIMAPYLLRDISGGLIAAAYSVDGNGHETRVFRMIEREDEGWVLHWTIDGLTGQCSGIAGRFGDVHIATSDYSVSVTPGHIYKYSGGFTSVPTESWSVMGPGPIGGIDVGRGGAVYVTATENPERGSSLFNPSVVSWTPRDLLDQTRLYQWWDASNPQDWGYTDLDGTQVVLLKPEMEGDPYEVLADARLGSGGTQPADFNVPRPLELVVTPTSPLAVASGTVTITRVSGVVIPAGHQVWRASDGATYTTQAEVDLSISTSASVAVIANVGGSASNATTSTALLSGNALVSTVVVDAPGITGGTDGIGRQAAPTLDTSTMPLPTMRFGVDGPTPRETRLNTDDDGKATNTSALGTNKALPGYDGAIYTTYMVIRAGDVTDPVAVFPEVLLMQNVRGIPATGAQAEYGILLNSDDQGALDVGKVYLDINGVSGGSGTSGSDIAQGTFDADPRRAFVLTFQHSGIFDVDNYSCFRINGTQVDRFELDVDLSFFPPLGDPSDLCRTIWGYRERVIGTQDGELYEGETHKEFTGWVAECVTVLGVHGATPHSEVPPGPNGALPGQQSGTVGASTPHLASEMEYFEGYLAHRHGFADLLPNGAGGGDVPDGQTGNNGGGFYPNHPFGGGPENVPGGGSVDTSGSLESAESLLVKYSADGTFVWAHEGSGMGRSAAYFEDEDDEGNLQRWIYTTGNVALEVGQNVNDQDGNWVVRRILDEGPTFSTSTGDGAWLVDSQFDLYEERLSYPIAVGSHGDVWTASGDVSTANLRNRIRRFRGDHDADIPEAGGFLQASHSFDLVNLMRRINGMAYADNQLFYAPGERNLGAEHMYVTVSESSTVRSQLVKLRVVREEPIPGAVPLESKVVGVRGGTVSVFDTDPASLVEPDGGADALRSGVAVESAVLFGKVYFVDGERYRVLDVFDGENGSVKPWVAEKGQIPPRANLLAGWLGRAVIAHGAGKWAMSRILDPLDWDEFPEVVTADMPVTGRTAPRATDVPDTITAIIPFSDDLLIWGCESSIYRMTGDPLGSNGQIDLITDVTGIARGTATKDPSGRLYFFGSQGGVWMYAPGSMPVNLVAGRIERDLQDIDRSLYRVELQWSYRDEGLYVFVIGRVDGATHTHWFWDQKNDGWWEDPRVHPVTASCTFDGDAPGDRATLLGSEDGHVRAIRDVATDDGERIDSMLLLGPFSGDGVRLLLSRIDATLDPLQGGATFEVFTGENPRQLGTPVLEGSFLPGYNPPRSFRAAGNNFWLRLRNATLDRWALESLDLHVAPFGEKRSYGR